MKKEAVLEFTSIDEVFIKTIGKTSFIVQNPQKCNDFDWVIGKEVVINGSVYIVDDVERYAHMPPYNQGEPIGLVVETNRPL